MVVLSGIPLFKRDIGKIESVQRQFTKRLKAYYSLSYTCRLDRLLLDSLYCRRVKSDFSVCYKMLNNLVAIFFKRSAVRMKLDKQHFISNRDVIFFVTVSLMRGIRFLIMLL